MVEGGKDYIYLILLSINPSVNIYLSILEKGHGHSLEVLPRGNIQKVVQLKLVSPSGKILLLFLC